MREIRWKNVTVVIRRMSRFLWHWNVHGYVHDDPTPRHHNGYTYTRRGAMKKVSKIVTRREQL